MQEADGRVAGGQEGDGKVCADWKEAERGREGACRVEKACLPRPSSSNSHCRRREGLWDGWEYCAYILGKGVRDDIRTRTLPPSTSIPGGEREGIQKAGGWGNGEWGMGEGEWEGCVSVAVGEGKGKGAVGGCGVHTRWASPCPGFCPINKVAYGSGEGREKGVWRARRARGISASFSHLSRALPGPGCPASVWATVAKGEGGWGRRRRRRCGGRARA